MNPERLAQAIYESIIKEDVQSLADALRDSDVNEKSDAYWKNAVALYSDLDDKQRRALLAVAEQCSINAISALLGYLDGTTLLDENRGDFRLTYEGGEPLNGDLQDILLAMVQEEEEGMAKGFR